ncbi:MAG: metal-sensitive transcriptional regulator [Frankiaceae bacterium]|jgi:DNA-binding FrmR family transcriptional regulator|nr:metal-sensitive transcriptional regulator [Frankiaceae bacterium]
MQLEPEEIASIILRLKRANGHLASVIRMLEDGSECEDALLQLAAANKAISRGGYALVAAGLHKCLIAEGPDGVDAQKLEKLFLTFA